MWQYLACTALLLSAACAVQGDARDEWEEPSARSTEPADAPSAKPNVSAVTAPPAPPSSDRLVLVAGGDVDFSRLRGQELLRDPSRDDLAPIRDWLDAADVRFVNLESTISDQRGETQKAWNQMVFTAPPPAADALSRANIDIVSLANNHAWDYGEAALFETFDRLKAADIAWVGAGRTKAEAYAPTFVERGGFKLAFVAVTDIWNQRLQPHPGRERIADAELSALTKAVRAARVPGVDKVIVSYHGGEEYFDEPVAGTRELLEAAIDAGADAVIGHHPHVVQTVAFYRGKPILYSLGNLLMRMTTGRPWSELGMLARLEFHRDQPTGVWLCPTRMYGLELKRIGLDPYYEPYFRRHFEALLARDARVDPQSAAQMEPTQTDGCARLTPR